MHLPDMRGILCSVEIIHKMEQKFQFVGFSLKKTADIGGMFS